MNTARKKEIENVANSLLEKYSNGVPIDPLNIATKMGIKVFTADLNKDTSGMVFYKDKEIYIEKRDYITRQVFSVAHELGHYCLHNDGTEHSTKRDALSGMGIDEKEKEANHFAACLLMPKNELMHFVSMGINLDALASYFNVSPIKMSFRLENLGIKVSI